VNTEKKDSMNNDGGWKAMDESINTEVPENLEKQLKRMLNHFRQDLREHPYVRRLERHGFPPRRNLIFLPRRWVQPLLVAGVGLAAAVFLGFLILGNDPPTWAQVQERFGATPFFAAKIYKRDIKIDTRSLNPLVEPKLVEVWAGYGNRMRIRSGRTVTFAEKGQILNTFDLVTRSEGGADGSTYFIVNRFGKLDTISLNSILMAESPPELKSISDDPSREWMSKEWSTSELIDTTSSVISDPLVSEDIVVFDHEYLYDKNSYGRARVWALRQSRLPIRIAIWMRNYDDLNYRWVRSPVWDMLFTYSKKQPREFFNPKAFADKLSDPANSIESLLYMFYQYPGGDTIHIDK
jgi:hypothetical protein